MDRTAESGVRFAFSTPAGLRSAVSSFLVIAALLASALPLLGVAHFLFGLSPAAYLPLYPLALLFFFKTRSPHRPGVLKALAFLLPGAGLTICGILFDRLSLIWIGSFWNFLAVCAVHGTVFAFPAPLLIFAAPPLSAFTSVAAGFSLRLWLTSLSVRILAFLDPASQAAGNVITFQGASFTVDRVCEGMKMAVASFLIAAVLARFSSQTGRWIILLAVFPLWLLANLIRILSLVVFHIPAGSAAHEITGLVLFVCMILAPLVFAALAFPGQKASSPPREDRQNRSLSIAALVICALLAFWFFSSKRTVENRPWPQAFAGFRLDPDSTKSDGRIAIYNAGDSSVILKEDPFAPGTAHDPRICFEAAGFSFGAESEEQIGSFVVRSARVEKAGKPARLFWWYSWEQTRSSSDVDWRIARMKGKRVTQWNLYGQDDGELRRIASALLNTEPPLQSQKDRREDQTR